MRQAIALIACAALAVFASCGGDEEPERAAASPGTVPGAETAPPAPDPEAAAGMPAGDQAEIRNIVIAAATNREPCEHLTRRYLREFVLDGVTSDDPETACREAEEGQPVLDEADVSVVSVHGETDRAEVRFTVAGIEQRASVVRAHDRWLIDSVDL